MNIYSLVFSPEVRVVRLRNLEGSVAVVTGGARGVGAAIAAELARAGADISIWDAPDWDAPIGYPLAGQSDLERVSGQIREVGRQAHPVAVDMRSLTAVEAAVADTVTALGSIDILVCAAGIRSAVPASKMTDEQWHSVVDTNLHGTYHAIRSALWQLEASGSGRVLIVAAEEGRRGAPSLSHYAAAAWGQIGLAKSLALESASFGVAVNVITPGPIATAMSDSADFWTLAQSGRNGVLSVDSASADAARQSLETVHPSATAYVSVESICAAAMFAIGAEGLEMTGSVLDISAGLAAMNTV